MRGVGGAPAPEIEERLVRWRKAGLITATQEESIRAYEAARKPAEAEPGEVAAAEAAAAAAAEASVRRPRFFEKRRPGGAQSSGFLEKPGVGPGRSPGFLEKPEGGALRQVPEQWPRVDGRTLGTVLAALALLAALAGVFAVTVDLLVSPLHNVRAEVEDVAHLVASAIGLIGGLRMAAANPGGRRLVYISLGINLAATVVLGFDKLFQPLNLLTVLVWLVLAGLVYGARFGRRAPVAT
ncbi:MAG TPA: hypothetical protein VF134_08360 [Candidatus Dormibacteraeota bacterium]